MKLSNWGWVRTSVLACGVVMGVSSEAHAAAITLTTAGTEYASGNYTLGFEFTVTTDFLVTSLGAYDSGQNGLNNVATVGLWSAQSGALLAQGVVGAGAAGRLDNAFRYVDIAPLSLTAGVHYVIGTFLTGDVATSVGTGNGGSASVNPLVQIVQDRFSNFDHTFSFPTVSNFHAGGAWLGANFDGRALTDTVDSVPVPEPGTLVLVGATLFIAARQIRRRLL